MGGVVLGVILLVAGAVIYWALNLNLEFVNDTTLGLILMIAGAITILLSLIVNAQRKKTTHVEQRRAG